MATLPPPTATKKQKARSVVTRIVPARLIGNSRINATTYRTNIRPNSFIQSLAEWNADYEAIISMINLSGITNNLAADNNEMSTVYIQPIDTLINNLVKRI